MRRLLVALAIVALLSVKFGDLVAHVWNDDHHHEHGATQVVAVIEASDLRDLMPSLESGMVPKMEACARAVTLGATYNTGQDCTAATRVYVHRSRVGDVTDALIAATRPLDTTGAEEEVLEAEED